MQVLSFRDMFNFDFSEKCSGIVSPHPFAYDFSKKKCFSCYILLTGQISLPDCLYILRYQAICVWQLFSFQLVT